MRKRVFTSRLTVVAVLLLLAAVPAFTSGTQEQAADTGTTDSGIVRGSEWHEAPMLHEKVLAGELPPLEERLPSEPMVEQVYEELGVYGGDWYRTWRDYNSGKWALGNLGEESLFRFAPDGSKVVPNAAKGYDVNEDATEFTI